MDTKPFHTDCQVSQQLDPTRICVHDHCSWAHCLTGILPTLPTKKHIPVHASTGVSMFLYQVTSLLMLVIINLCSAILCLNPLRPTRINHHKSEAPSRQGCSYALIHWDWQELLRNHLTWVLNRYWVVQYCQDPRTRHNKQLASHNWHCRKFVLRLSHRAKRSTIVPWQLMGSSTGQWANGPSRSTMRGLSPSTHCF